MYTDTHIQKIIKFSFIIAMLVITIGGTLYIKKYVPPEYYSFGEQFRSITLAVESMKYNILYAESSSSPGGNQVAAVGESLYSMASTSDLEAQGKAVDIPVLVYHGIVQKADRFSMTAQTFSDQMFALKRAGYRTISLDDFNQFINGVKTLPDKSFLLTFDDGRTDSYEGADPILNALGFKAVMFVATADSLHTTPEPHSYYLDEVALHRMVDSGRWELGSHAIQANTQGGLIPIDANGTLGNFLSNRMWLADQNRLETIAEYTDRVNRELSQSKQDLQNTFGIHVIALSYPFSDFGEQNINNPAAIGIISKIMHENYSFAFQQIWPIDNSYLLNYPDMDHYHMRRVEVATDLSGTDLVTMLQRGHEKTLPWTDNFSTDAGWSGTWGTESITNSQLHITSLNTTTGAFVFLDGTHELDNYIFNTNVFLDKGSDISIIARFADGNNNVSCIFGNDTIRIEQRETGAITVLAKNKNNLIVPYPLASLGISVNGSSVQCLEGGSVVLSADTLSSGLNHGGVAIQVWDPQKGNASLFVNKVDLVPISQENSFLSSLPTYNPQ